MIDYKFPEEKAILLHYADVLQNKNAKDIILCGFAENGQEADILAKFYWSVVDQAVQDNGVGVAILEREGVEHWLETVFHSLNGYMVSNGYLQYWDEE
jgi:hypothetical protein